ncbi:glycosyltransferase family 4 protein [Paenibacillus aceris]|uniref:Glycosyltransferase involved in cell wall biosynthesis n=1 Tax=Paenibacillus aceris TaxID=869555 RepID=A0ABS4IA56_9BACL|nr:glycosyltransferase family 4 protein [Paenibacillus aceris]MBP1966954.1 glycosyltransferase involved in cell wall biosynthesis [Paenibacillus aceris]NHW39318.1 glycosyltransferase family 4 protein [Paenibacillus aceris]
MKIAMIAWEYPPQFSGGLGVHCHAIVHELVKQGVNIDFYLPSYGQTDFDIPAGMVLHRVDMDRLLPAYLNSDHVIWETVNQFKNRLKEVFQPEGVDLIHAHDWMGVYAAFGMNDRYRVPLVWTVHSTESDRAAGSSPHPGIMAIEQEAMHATDHTIAVSARTKASLIDNYSALPDAITVIYNGIDTSAYEHLKARDYTRTDGHVLFLGRVTGQKGPGDFLKAARMILAKRNVRFMIAGEGDLLASLRRKARMWKIDEHVTFTGAVTGEQLIECYKHARVYVLPSISEPFGITVLEAMASGIPTITTTTSGVSEIVKHVYLIEPGNPGQLAQGILTLLDNRSLQRTLAVKGAEEVKHFSWKSVAVQTFVLYTEIITQFNQMRRINDE